MANLTAVDPGTLALLVTAVFGGLGALLVSIGTLYSTITRSRIELAHSKVTSAKLDELKVVTDKVHDLTNSAMTAMMEGKAVALRANANSLRMIYELRKDPSDKVAYNKAETLAGAAERAYEEQARNQEQSRKRLTPEEDHDGDRNS